MWWKISSCPRCGKAGEAGRNYDIDGLLVRNSLSVVHKVSDGSHSGLVAGEIMESCGPFSQQALLPEKEGEDG